MLRIYEQQGKLPVWHLMGCETNTMPGNSAIPVVADAYLKGFSGFDRGKAYEAMKVSALADDRGLKSDKPSQWGTASGDYRTHRHHLQDLRDKIQLTKR